MFVGGLAVLALLFTAGANSAHAMLVGWIDYADASYITPTNNGNSEAKSIGFNFSYYGEDNLVTSTAYIHYSGYLGIGTTSPDNVNFLNQPDPWPYSSWHELRSRMVAPLAAQYNYDWPRNSHIYYQTVGSPGQQIFAVTYDVYLEPGFDHKVIYQVQLYEATGNIHFLYLEVPHALTGARVGVSFGDGEEYTGFWYDGDQNYDDNGTRNANIQGLRGNLTGHTLIFNYDAESGSYLMAAIPEPGALMLMTAGAVLVFGGRPGRRGRDQANQSHM